MNILVVLSKSHTNLIPDTLIPEIGENLNFSKCLLHRIFSIEFSKNKNHRVKFYPSYLVRRFFIDERKKYSKWNDKIRNTFFSVSACLQSIASGTKVTDHWESVFPGTYGAHEEMTWETFVLPLSITSICGWNVDYTTNWSQVASQ